MRRNVVLVGDACRRLKEVPTQSVDTVITSPPYFLLRNYQVEGQLGLEASVQEWVANLSAVFDEVARVLKPAGSLWLNLGDSYARKAEHGAPPKGLVLAPERLLLALAEHGWVVRNKVAWCKPNPLPASVEDRLTCSWEPPGEARERAGAWVSWRCLGRSGRTAVAEPTACRAWCSTRSWALALWPWSPNGWGGTGWASSSTRSS